MKEVVEYVVVTSAWTEQLTQFFRDVVVAKDDAYFHPHPLTFDMAEKIATYRGKDLYYLQIKSNKVVGYAMLRGWDKGYEIPSVGIVIHPDFQNQGLGREFVEFLHNQARLKGADRIRLKVYPNNVRAMNLYEKMGYSFTNEENGQLVGYCYLKIQ